MCYTLSSEESKGYFNGDKMSNRFNFVPGLELVTRKQSKALYLIAPGPLGMGLKYREAAEELGISKASFAEELGISKASFIDRIRSFKNKFPRAWENFLSIRDVSRRHRINIQKPLSLGVECRGLSEEDIVDKF